MFKSASIFHETEWAEFQAFSIILGDFTAYKTFNLGRVSTGLKQKRDPKVPYRIVLINLQNFLSVE